MRKLLGKISGHSYDHPWRMLAILVVVIAALAFGAISNMKPPTNAVSIPGTEANVGLERMSELFPDAGKSSARVVVIAPDGKTLDAYAANVKVMTAEFSKVEGVSRAVSPFDNPTAMSANRRTAFIQIQLANDSRAIDQKTADDVNDVIQKNRIDGLSVEQGGDIVNNEPHKILGPGEALGVVIALGVLLLTFASLAAAGMPLLTAVLALGASMTGLFSLSQVVEINSTTPALAAMLGLAVGIDYSLFIISRYRGYLLAGASYREAAVHAVKTAGSAVVFAAATVFIALAALSVVRIPFMTTMGLTAAGTVAMAAIMSVTFLPVFFRLAGSKIVSKRALKKVEVSQAKGYAPHHTDGKQQIWYRWGAFVARRPIVSIVVPLLVIGLVALPVKSLTLGLPTDQYAAESTTQRKAYDAISEGFGVGYNAPLVVVVEDMQPVTDAEKSAAKQALMKQAKQQPANPNLTEKQAAEYVKRLHLQKIGEKIAREENVQKVMPTLASEDGTSGILQVIPKTAPYDEATKTLIYSLRDSSKQRSWATGDAKFTVTGSTALQIDINTKLAHAIPVYLLVVVGLSFILLVVAFRSILVPIKATLGYLLSVSAMFGALVAVFQWGWFGLAEAPAPIVSFIPILGTGILFGLAMDYEFFLVSNMREEYTRTGDAKQAVVNGFGMGSKVVVTAASIMIAVFAGFISNENSTVQALGFALAVGILADAFLVRMIMVPAVMALAGKHAWWMPAWLNRALPAVPLNEE